MNPSLNEITSIVTKAARGAGLEWGAAEEVGWAARWLAARRLPGAELALAMLEPVGETLRLGQWIADRASVSAAPEIAIPAPMFLVPFVEMAARASGRDLLLSWRGVGCRIGPVNRFEITGPNTDALMMEAARIRLSADASPANVTAPADRPNAIADPAWVRLETLAHRTYVPATEQSRQAGAGAGLSDND